MLKLFSSRNKSSNLTLPEDEYLNCSSTSPIGKLLPREYFSLFPTADSPLDTLRGISSENYPGITMTGWLFKRGEKNKAYRRRWFELKERTLYYHKQPNKPHIGSISLIGAFVRKSGKSIEIITDARTYFIDAETPENCDNWLFALRQHSVSPRRYIYTHQLLLLIYHIHFQKSLRNHLIWERQYFGVSLPYSIPILSSILSLPPPRASPQSPDWAFNFFPDTAYSNPTHHTTDPIGQPSQYSIENALNTLPPIISDPHETNISSSAHLIYPPFPSHQNPKKQLNFHSYSTEIMLNMIASLESVQYLQSKSGSFGNNDNFLTPQIPSTHQSESTPTEFFSFFEPGSSTKTLIIPGMTPLSKPGKSKSLNSSQYGHSSSNSLHVSAHPLHPDHETYQFISFAKSQAYNRSQPSFASLTDVDTPTFPSKSRDRSLRTKSFFNLNKGSSSTIASFSTSTSSRINPESGHSSMYSQSSGSSGPTSQSFTSSNTTANLLREI